MRCSIAIVMTLGLLLPALPAWSEVRRFGVEGRSGQDGRSGRSGNSGTDQVFFHNGTPTTLDLSGQSGEDGEDGRDAERAQCDRSWRSSDHPNGGPEYDLRGANGGDGGRGGNGGLGGNGGNLVLYYQNEANLRNLLVRSTPGAGGRSGRGGYASYGCQCPTPRWEVKKYTGKDKDQKVTTHHYDCTDGRNGRNGENGYSGTLGQIGRLTLIQRSTPLPGEVIQAKTTLGNWVRDPIALSRNFWLTRSGATSLFAPGSLLHDNYAELTERAERSVQLQWQAKEPIARFANLPVQFDLNPSKEIAIAFPTELWSKRSQRRSGNTDILTIDHVIARTDALNLSILGMTGTGSKLAIKLTDRAAQSAQVKTEAMRLNYRVRNDNLEYISQFDGVIPDGAIETRGNDFRLAIGAFPIPEAMKKVGTAVELELTVTRSFGVDRGDQVITWRGIIGELPSR
jgi:hypothetical protein